MWKITLGTSTFSQDTYKTSLLSGWHSDTSTLYLPPLKTMQKKTKKKRFSFLHFPLNSALTFVIPRQVEGAGEVHHRSSRSIWPAGVSVKGSVAEQVCVKEKSKKPKSSRCEKSILCSVKLSAKRFPYLEEQTRCSSLWDNRFYTGPTFCTSLPTHFHWQTIIIYILGKIHIQNNTEAFGTGIL